MAYTLRSPGSAGASVFVEPFPPTGAKCQVDKDNSHHPLWSRDGRELSYGVLSTQQVVADVRTQPTFTFGNPCSPAEFATSPFGLPRNHDLMPDAKRFVLAAATGGPESGVAGREIQVVVNWFEELKRRVPTGR